MTIRTDPWPAGTPTWVDLGADDVTAATAFYAALFGWEYSSGGEESGGYLLATLDGAAVAGIGPKQDPGTPSVWTTYLATDDVDASARAVSAAGGQVVAEPFDVMSSGRMAIVADPGGAALGLWQAGDHIGAGRVNEPGTLVWNELHARDEVAARAFYAAVFGYEYRDVGGEAFVYATFTRAGDRAEVGGILRDAELPAGAPDHWLTWFATGDVDASAARAEELGGKLRVPVSDTPFGRATVVQGPQGEVFGLIALATR